MKPAKVAARITLVSSVRTLIVCPDGYVNNPVIWPTERLSLQMYVLMLESVADGIAGNSSSSPDEYDPPRIFCSRPSSISFLAADEISMMGLEFSSWLHSSYWWLKGSEMWQRRPLCRRCSRCSLPCISNIFAELGRISGLWLWSRIVHLMPVILPWRRIYSEGSKVLLFEKPVAS